MEGNILFDVLNVLVLLKTEPKDMNELFQSGAYYSWRDLDRTIHTCLKAGLIGKEYDERQKRESRTAKGWWRRKPHYYLTSMGISFLSFYSHCEMWGCLGTPVMRYH